MTDGKNPTNTIEYVWDRIFDTIDIVVRQMTSGRWILTISAAYILIHYAHTPGVDPKDIILICKDIALFYFVMRDLTKNNGGSNGQANPSTNQ